MDDKTLSPGRILIRVPNWVGDAVMAVPALREFRRIFASSRITLLARPWVAGLFDGEALSDDVVIIEDARGFKRSARQFLSTARRLRRERYDLAILLQNAFGAALLARAAGARTIAGYPTDGRRALLDHIIQFDPEYKSKHQVCYYLNIASQLEEKLFGASRIECKNANPNLIVTEEQKRRARTKIKGQAIGAGWPEPPAPLRIVVINPGATNSRAKQWPAERFAEAADNLYERDGFQAVIVGAGRDVEVAEKVRRLMRSKAAQLAGQTEISELKAVLACASLVISNDTGTAHVSAALGIPTVVVFGPTEHISTRPLSDTSVVVRHDVECSPCMLRDCPIDHRCMTGVQVSDVYRAAQSLLASAAR